MPVRKYWPRIDLGCLLPNSSVFYCSFSNPSSIKLLPKFHRYRLASENEKANEHIGQCKRTGGCYNELVVAFFSTGGGVKHTGQCKRTGGCYSELVVAFYSTGGGVKGKKIYIIPVDFIIYL